MDIKSSLAIEESHPTTINLIFSGSFAKVYNQSFYLLTEVLGKKLKPSAKRIKSANNRFVVSGGFPKHRVEKEFANLTKTAWGYQITGEFSTEGYAVWLARHETAAQAVVNDVAALGIATSCTQLCVQGVAPGIAKDTVYKNSSNLSLTVTPQQVAYLLTWQRGNYPIEVDLGFIESLKQQIISSI